jgi:replicative DNA helicase
LDCHTEGAGTRPENRQQEITAISRSLKAVAKELKMPVLVLSQLSRAPERRDDARPRLSDLRESGAIEQDADVVIFLYRDRKDAVESGQGEMQLGWITRLSVAKQRNGPTGAFPLYFNRQYTRFDLLETSQLVAEDE